MNTHDFPFRHAGYEFPEAGFRDKKEEDGYFIDDLFDQEGSFGEGDCAGL